MSTVFAPAEEIAPVAPPAGGTTVVGAPEGPPPTIADRRNVRGVSRRDIATLAGAAASALCTTLLLFGRLTPLSGVIGFLVVNYAVFLATYGVLVAIEEPRPI